VTVPQVNRAEDAYALLQQYILRSTQREILQPLEVCILVDQRYFFPAEVPKTKGIRERGYYVDLKELSVARVETSRRFEFDFGDAIKVTGNGVSVQKK
jgi:hypothetical protein